MNPKILYITSIFFYVNLSIYAGNSLGNQLRKTNNPVFETRHLADFKHDELDKSTKKYDVFHIKSNKIISYLQEKTFNNDLFIDFLHLGTWQLSLYINEPTFTEYVSYQGLSCQSVGEIHFNIASNFIEAYIDNEKTQYFIEPLEHFTNNTQHQDLYVVYDLKDVLSIDKKNKIQAFLKTARDLEQQQENNENICDISLNYETNVSCLDNKNIFPILANSEKGGHFSAFPNGLDIDAKTGEILIQQSNSNIYIISYKKDNCVSDFALDLLDLPNADFELSKTHFYPNDAPFVLKDSTNNGFFSGLGVENGIFYPNLVPKHLHNQAIEITHTVSNSYCENSETKVIFIESEKKYVLQTFIVLEDTYITAQNRMRTDLLERKILPLSQPYSISPWKYQGHEQVEKHTDFPQNTVDWVLLELRDAKNIHRILAQKAALLLSDGRIINFDGHSAGVVFENIDEYKNCYVVVRHRNHIDIISKDSICIAEATYQDSNNCFKIVYANAHAYKKHLATKQMALFSGDADGNNVVSVIDFEYFQLEYGKMNTYNFFDFNLDGTVDEIDFECYMKNVSTIGLKDVRY